MLVGTATSYDFPQLAEILPSTIKLRTSSNMASPLVAAFTPAEREALSKFKSEYFQKGLKEAAGESVDISTLEIWNVPMAHEDPRVDVILVKFLRAKYHTPLFVSNGSKLVLPETYTQFVKTLKWRREFEPRKAATEKQDSVYDTVGYVIGKDKKGRLITYNLYGGLDNEAVNPFLVLANDRYLEI